MRFLLRPDGILLLLLGTSVGCVTSSEREIRPHDAPRLALLERYAIEKAQTIPLRIVTPDGCPVALTSVASDPSSAPPPRPEPLRVQARVTILKTPPREVVGDDPEEFCLLRSVRGSARAKAEDSASYDLSVWDPHRSWYIALLADDDVVLGSTPLAVARDSTPLTIVCDLANAASIRGTLVVRIVDAVTNEPLPRVRVDVLDPAWIARSRYCTLGVALESIPTFVTDETGSLRIEQASRARGQALEVWPTQHHPTAFVGFDGPEVHTTRTLPDIQL